MKSYKSTYAGIRKVPTKWYEAAAQDFKSEKTPLREASKKWLYCSWAHYSKRCYPGVDIPFKNEEWHCEVCRPCWLGLYESGAIEEDGRAKKWLDKNPSYRKKKI